MLTLLGELVAGGGSVGVRDDAGVDTNVFFTRGEEGGFGTAGKG